MKIDPLNRNISLLTLFLDSVSKITVGNYADVVSVFDSEKNCADTRARFQSVGILAHVLVYQVQCLIGKVVGDWDVHPNLTNPMKLGRIVQ